MKTGPKPIPIIDRLEDKIFYSPDGCWYWTGSTHRNGYGVILVGNKKVRLAHRVSYQIYKGDVGRMCVLHSCDNPPCVNPDHLSLGTNADNVQDRVRRGRGAPMNGMNNPSAILDELQVLVIRDLLRLNVNRRVIAGYFKISPVNVDSIRKRKTWKDL